MNTEEETALQAAFGLKKTYRNNEDVYELNGLLKSTLQARNEAPNDGWTATWTALRNKRKGDARFGENGRELRIVNEGADLQLELLADGIYQRMRIVGQELDKDTVYLKPVNGGLPLREEQPLWEGFNLERRGRDEYQLHGIIRAVTQGHPLLRPVDTQANWYRTVGLIQGRSDGTQHFRTDKGTLDLTCEGGQVRARFDTQGRRTELDVLRYVTGHDITIMKPQRKTNEAYLKGA